MAALQHVGAERRGQVTPRSRSDEAAGGSGFKGKNTENDGDCAASLIARAIARASELGIEVQQLDEAAWLLRHARGGDIGTVCGIGALTAAVAGFEAALRAERELLRRMRGGARHG